MNNWVQATPERGGGRARRGRLPATSLPRLLALCLLLWPLARAEGQNFLINPIADRSVSVGTSLGIQVTVTDSNIPPSQLNFTLASNRPNTDAANATISLNYGVFSWTPAQAQIVTFTVTAISLVTSYQTSTSFTVIVTNAAPPAGGVVIDTILPQTVTEGSMLIFTNYAHATDNPNNALVFSLLNAPAGASIVNASPTSGVFTWVPTSAQALTPSYTIREIVTEASGLGSNYQDFQVTVTRSNNCAQLDEFLAAVQQGGYFVLSNCTTIVLTNALTISNSVTLDGGANNVTIAGQGLSRLFTVLPGVTNFTLRGLTLSGGQDTSGGSLYVNPGAVVLLTNCTLAGNGAVGIDGTAGNDASGGGTIGGNGGNGTAGAQALGGAIYNLGGLTICNSSFLTNRAAGGSGGSGGNGSDGTYQGGNGGNGAVGALGYGGAIFNLGTLTLTNCTFSGNTASGGSAGNGGSQGIGPFPGNAGRGAAGASGSGAAIYNGLNAVAVNCTFSGNSAQSGSSTAGGTDPSTGDGGNGPRGPDSLGGGIFNRGSGTFVNCTFYNNSVAGGDGGNGGDSKVTSGFTAGNGGSGGNGIGGGLYNTGAVVVVNCTFSGCGAVGGSNGVAGIGPFPGSDGSPGRGRGGDIAQGSGVFVLQNSILAVSSAGTNAYDTSASRITDGGFNISSDASLNLSGTSLKNTDPLLSPLASNGGPTQTMALQTNSPALNRVPAALSPPTDQRGVPRPEGPACDVGAYELVTVAAILVQPQSQTNANSTPVTFTVSAIGDSLGYQWYFNSAPIANATGTSYSLASVNQTNAGTYDVVITNGFGAVTSAPATLVVIFPPVFTVQPTNLTVLAGSNVAFTASVASVVPVVYQWQLNGTDIAGATNTGVAGLTSTSYAITNAQAANNGTYTVVVTNSYGSITSAPAVLTVYTLPTIATQPVSQTVIIGSNVTFSVVASGTPPFVYQWRFNGANLPAGTAATYSITNAQPANAGSYDVNVSSYFGFTTSLPATLTVASPFTISGQVFDPSGTDGLPGVKVSAGTNSVVTDVNGNFVLSGLSSNTYAVTPSLPCYVFGPSNIVVGVGPTNAFGLNFFATNDYHIVRGLITNGPAGVTVTVSGTNGTSTATSGPGTYGLSNLCPGFYLVVPTLAGYRFQPPTNSVLVPPDTNTVSFTAFQVFGISGQITQGTNGLGLSGITVAVTGPVSTNVTTGANGAYLVGGLAAGNYVVTPTAPGCYHLNLPPRAVTLGPSNADGTDFVALRDAYTISGRLTNGAVGVSGITLSAGGTNVAVSGADGSYVFSNLCAGAYTVTPSASCYLFNPSSAPASVGPGNFSGLDFSASPDVRTISGRITEGGIGVSNVTVQAGNQTTNTDLSGNYVLSGLCPGSYTVTPIQACRIFTPSSILVSLGPSTGGVNFVTFSNDLSRIRGQITDGANGLSNVLVTATAAGTATTDAGGNYMFSNLCPGVYTVTPSVTNRCLNTPFLTVTLGSAQTTNAVDFVATPGQYSISGTLGGMPPGPKVAVTIAGLTGTNVLVTSNGAYGISNLCPGTYSVTPSNTCFQFYPASRTTTVGPSDDSLDFAVAGGGIFSLGGQVARDGIGLSNVTVTAAGQTNTTDASGNYTFSYLCPGVYAVTASAPNYQFLPATNYVTLSTTDSNGVNFAAVGVVSVNGRVVQGASGLPGVKVSAGTSVSFTGPGGYYTNLNLPEGANVQVVPSLAGYAFAPSAQSLVLLSNTNLPDFLGFPSLALTSAGNGTFHLAFAQAFTCEVLVSTDLSHWLSVFATNDVSANTPLLEFTDTDAANLSRRFYRVGQTFAGPPVLTGLLTTNRSVSLACVAAPVLACQIEASTNLTSWVTIFRSNLPPAAPFQFRFGDATNLPVRFYRLSQTPGF